MKKKEVKHVSILKRGTGVCQQFVWYGKHVFHGYWFQSSKEGRGSANKVSNQIASLGTQSFNPQKRDGGLPTLPALLYLKHNSVGFNPQKRDGGLPTRKGYVWRPWCLLFQSSKEGRGSANPENANGFFSQRYMFQSSKEGRGSANSYILQPNEGLCVTCFNPQKRDGGLPTLLRFV